MSHERTQHLKRTLKIARVLSEDGKHIESIEVLLADAPQDIVRDIYANEEERWADHLMQCSGCVTCDNPGL